MCQQGLGEDAWGLILRDEWNVKLPVSKSVIHNLAYWQGFQVMVLICSSALRSLAKGKAHLLSEVDDVIHDGRRNQKGQRSGHAVVDVLSKTGKFTFQ